MATRNRFEQVDEIQEDAITLELWKSENETFGKVTMPAAASGGQLESDKVSADLPVVDAFRSAIKLANTVKMAVVVIDPDNLWQQEWGALYRPVGNGR